MRFRARYWLAVVPALALLGAPFVANRVEPRVFGVPFFLAWLAGSILCTSLCMWMLRRLDRASR